MNEGDPKRSTSASQKPPSRPSTPLRPSSRTSLRDSQTFTPRGLGARTSAFPLEGLEPAFAELSDSMATLEYNFIHLQVMHESLSRFNESFAAFLYGMNMNAFCVDFPEAPIPESFARAQKNADSHSHSPSKALSKPDLGEETFLTTDTSFIENPPSSRAATKFATPAPAQRASSGLSKRGGTEINRGRGGSVPGKVVGRGLATKGSGIARGKPGGGR